MATAPAVRNKEPLGTGGILLIALTAAASALGYYCILVYLVAVILDNSHLQPLLRLSNWLGGSWYLSYFFGMLTTPASLFLVAIGSVFPVSQRAKVIAWLIALGGGLGWFIVARILSSGW
jgi:hypothetical protein